MVKKKYDGPVFEIFVVLAIVAIVAVTGLVLTDFERDIPAASFGGDQLTGFAVADYGEEAESDSGFLDVGINNIIVTPPTPLTGKPLKIEVVVANKGTTAIKTPFYVKAELIPNGENAKSTVLNSVIPEFLEPGDTSTAVFNIAMVTKEGPLKIIATADSTVKLDDQNPANDQRSKTVIIVTD